MTNPYLDPEPEQDDNPYLLPLEPRRTLGQRVSRAGRAFLDAGAASTIPLYRLGGKALDALLPGRPASDWAERQIGEFEASQAAAGPPEGTAEKIAALAGSLAGYGSQAMLTGAGVGGALARYAPAGSRLANLGKLASSEGRGLRAILARQAAGTAVTSPFDALQAVDPQTSASTLFAEADKLDPRLAGIADRFANMGYGGRFATELGTSLVAGSAVDALLSSFRGVRKTSLGQNPNTPVQATPPTGAPVQAPAPVRPTGSFAHMDQTAQAAEWAARQGRNLQQRAGLPSEPALAIPQAAVGVDELGVPFDPDTAARMALEKQQARRAAEVEAKRLAAEQAEAERVAAVAAKEKERLAQEQAQKQVWEEPPEEPEVVAKTEEVPEQTLAQEPEAAPNRAPTDEELDARIAEDRKRFAESDEGDVGASADDPYGTKRAERQRQKAEAEVAAEAKRLRDVATEALPRIKWSKAWGGVISLAKGSGMGDIARGVGGHPLVTDGTVVLTREGAEAALPRTAKENISTRTINAEAVDKVWADAAKSAKLDAEPTGRWQTGDEIPRYFFRVGDDLVAVDANRFAYIQKLKPTHWKAPKPEADPKKGGKPLVAYRGKEPVAVLMPLSSGAVDDEVRGVLVVPKKPKKKGEAGFAAPGTVQALASAGLGATVGAATDEDDPLAGALKGAAVGAGALGAVKYLAGKPSGTQHYAPGTVAQQQPNVHVKQPSLGQGGMRGGRATSYERGVTQGTVGKPKSYEFTPSVAGLMDPGREIDLALQRVRQNSPIRQTVNLPTQRKIAERVGVADLLGSERTSLTPPEMHALGDFIRAGEQEMYDLAERLSKANPQVNPQLVADLDDKFDAALRATTAAAAKLDQAGSEHGRALQLLQHIAKNQASPVFWQQLIARQFRIKGVGALSGGQAAMAKINQLIRDNSITTPQGSLALTKEGQKLLADYVWKLQAPQGTLDLLADLRRAGLLTNPATHIANVTSNLAFGGAEQLSHGLASVLDRVLSGGDIQKRSLMASMDRAQTYYKELVQGLGGQNQMKAVLKDLDEHAAQGHKRVYYNPEKIEGLVGKKLAPKVMSIAQAYSDKVYGALGWEDKLFRGAAMLASLEERANLRALKEGLKKGTPAFDARVRQLSTWNTANLDDKLAAKLDGEVATFTDRNMFSEWVNMGKNRARTSDSGLAKAMGFMLDVVAPFVKTPSNIVYRSLQYSPLGLAASTPKFTKLAYERITGQALSQAPEATRKLLMRFSRGTIGTGLFGLGLALYNEGKAVGSTPADASARADREQANIPPTSIKFGDQWVNVVRTLGPVGMAMILGAEYAEAVKGEGDNPLIAVALGIAPIAEEQPLLKGVSETAQIITGKTNDEDKKFMRFAGSTAGSFIPAGVAAMARATDPVGSRRKESITDYLKDRIPGQRQELTPRLSPLGDVEPGRGLSEFLPGRPTRERTDPLTSTQKELGTGTQSARRLTLSNGEREPDALYRARRAFSDSLLREKLRKLQSSTKWENADPDERKELWEKRVTDSRREATRKFKKKHKSDYKPD